MECILCGNNTDKVIATKLRAGEEIPVYHCEKCDFGMLDTDHQNYKPIDYTDEYNKISRTGLNKPVTPAEISEAFLPFQQDRVDAVKELIAAIGLDSMRRPSEPVTLLEIGCSAGMFLYQIQDYVAKADGVDLDVECIGFARKKCKGRFSTHYHDNAIITQPYEIICMFQTLEHIEDPLGFMEKELRRFLKPKGRICIEVPNLRDALVHVYDLPGHQQFYYHRAHLWYFTETSLMKLMKMLGFEGKVEFVQDYGLFNHVHWLTKDEPQLNCVNGLSKPILPFRDDISEKVVQALRLFWYKINDDYKHLLCEQDVGSNLLYTGKRVR